MGGGSDRLDCPCRDLLGQEPQEKLEIRLCPDGSGQLYVPGLTEFQVQSVDDINKVHVWGGLRGGEVRGAPCPQAEPSWSRTCGFRCSLCPVPRAGDTPSQGSSGMR